MYNILIIGCARSGTSTASGMLGEDRYWMGDSLWEGDAYNPKGYFEDMILTKINEDILSEHMESPLTRADSDPAVLLAPSQGFWFGQLMPTIRPVVSDQGIASRMAAYLSKHPYCLKDPQFCYTLSEWRHLLSNEKYICVFRSPRATASSIVQMCETQVFYKPCGVDMDYAYTVWQLMYEHVLQRHARNGDWLFLHYEQLFNDNSLNLLERFVGHAVRRSFAEKHLKKPAPDDNCPDRLRGLYDELCALASFSS